MAIEVKAYAGPDDRIQLRVDLICADDEAAKEHPRRLADGCAVELWRDQIFSLGLTDCSEPASVAWCILSIRPASTAA